MKEVESPTSNLPPHIVEQWKRAVSMGSGKQKAMRDIVLNAVQPAGKNKYAGWSASSSHSQSSSHIRNPGVQFGGLYVIPSYSYKV